MKQFVRFKKSHPDCVLFFRMGDFYEMFYEDAKLANQVLGITLTQRSEGVPMAGVPYHASQMYAKNISTLLLHLYKDGKVDPFTDDEIERETCITHGGEVTNARVRDILGLPELKQPVTEPAAADGDGKDAGKVD